MLPRVNMVGRVVRTPEQRFSQSGSSIVSFSLVSSEKYKDKEDTCFLDCVVFGALGEKVVMPYLNKGSMIFVSGKIKQGNWVDQQGNKRSKHTVTIESLEMLGNRDEAPQNTNEAEAHHESNQPPQQSQYGGRPDYAPPSQNPQPAPAQQAQSAIPEIDINETEIPF